MARISFSTAGAGTDKATDYFAIEMVDALVTSISATSAGDRPVDQVAFTARQMRWIDQTAGTPVSFSFDLI
jgi:type VI protein secretion system component Hcp